MAENTDPTCPACAPDGASVWEDEVWVLTHSAPDLVLTLREHADFGHLDDEVASQLGRIANRLVRIADGADATRVQGGTHLQVRLPASADLDLHAVATKLANWGGEARA